jgi:hypothetical protein
MSAPQYKDLALSTLAAGILAGDGSFDVAAGEGANFSSLAASQHFYIRVSTANFSKWEIMKVTARSTDTLTVTRNIASSTGAAQAFDAGDQVVQVVPAANFARASVAEILAGTDEEKIITPAGLGSLFPAIVAGDAAKIIRVNAGETAYEKTSSLAALTIATLTSSEARTPKVTSNAASGITFETSGGISLAIGHQASMVNNVTFYGGAAGGSCLMDTGGSDTDVSLQVRLKGAGDLSFFSSGGSAQQFGINHTASAVNRIIATGAATGSAPNFSATGADTNIGIRFISKGTGAFSFLTNTSAQQVSIEHVASAVNYLTLNGSATGGSCKLGVSGADTNIALQVASKGTSSIAFLTGAGTTQFSVGHTASAVNYIIIAGGVAGGPPTLQATGSDTNVDIYFVPKGSGVVKFGTHSALAGESVSGYITIKDAGGTSRKLAVVS